MTAELVGPLPKVYYYGAGASAAFPAVRGYVVPSNTVDLRARLCTDHHPACDCREALLNEELSEHRAEWRAVREAFDQILTGHLVDAWDDDQTPCKCTGCQIARAAHIWIRTAARR